MLRLLQLSLRRRGANPKSRTRLLASDGYGRETNTQNLALHSNGVPAARLVAQRAAALAVLVQPLEELERVPRSNPADSRRPSVEVVRLAGPSASGPW